MKAKFVCRECGGDPCTLIAESTNGKGIRTPDGCPYTGLDVARWEFVCANEAKE